MSYDFLRLYKLKIINGINAMDAITIFLDSGTLGFNKYRNPRQALGVTKAKIFIHLTLLISNQ